VSTFLELAERLVHGQRISIHPVIPGEKCPGKFSGGRWWPLSVTEYKRRLPTDEELRQWGTWPEAGLAVLACPLSGLVAVDFDHRPEFHAALAALLPRTPVKKRGEKGLTWFYRHSGEENKQWKVGGEVVVEVLADHSCTIPPSVHPTGLLYEWEGPGLADIDKADLPVLPADLFERLDRLFEVLEPKGKPTPPPMFTAPTHAPDDDFKKAEHALDCVSSDDYETWVKVGMAIHSAFPGADGFSIWDQWSQRSPKYQKNRPGEMRRKWSGFRPGEVTLATLFHLAKENGFVQSRPKEAPSPVDVSGLLNQAPGVRTGETKKEEPKRDAAPERSFALPVELLTSAPGVVGEVAQWLTANNFYHQHAYSLAAALSFVGMLKGHQVCTEEDARTNLLCIAVGPSSSGKSGPLKGLQMLASAVGVDERMVGEPASEQGLFKAVADAKNKAFLPWDEIGLAFKAMFAPGAQNHRAGIIRLILKLYSMADTVVRGSQYANHDGKMGRIDLVQPCLCLYGTTTADGIYHAFSSQEAINGFAARLLIFESHDYVAERQGGRKVPPSEDLIYRLRKVAGETDVNVGGNLAGVDIISPVTVPYSQRAWPLVQAASKRFEALKNAAILAKRQAEEAIWGRAYEHAIKVALTVEDGPEITVASVNWAVALVETLCRNMIVAAGERIADNQTHAELNVVLRVIKDASPNWISTNDLYKRTRSLARFKRQEHLNQLIEEGTIEVTEEDTSGRKRKLFRYVG
jgi:hypothetical protein